MAKPFSRGIQIAALLKKHLAPVVSQELADPRLGFITISDVVMSPDLSLAKVYVHILNDSQATETLKILNSDKTKSFIRTNLAKQVTLRLMPKLAFYHDCSTIEGLRMEEKIKASLS